jgi:hypothetical protein
VVCDRVGSKPLHGNQPTHPPSSLASQAACTRAKASSRETQLLPLVCPHFLGATWSSIMIPAMPAWGPMGVVVCGHGLGWVVVGWWVGFCFLCQ